MSTISFSSLFQIPFMQNSTESFNPRHSEALEGFEASLADRLKRLQMTKPKGIKMNWMEETMEVLSATHKDLRSFIVDLQFSSDDKLFDECLNDRRKLLEICNLLNSEKSYFYFFKLSVESVLHLLDFSGEVTPYDVACTLAMNNLEELPCRIREKLNSGLFKTSSLAERSTAILQSMNKSLQLGKEKWSSKGKLLMRAMYGVMVMSLFAWNIFAYGLTGSVYPFGELMKIPEGLLWSASFRNLQEEVNRDIQRGVCDLGVFLSNEIRELFFRVEILAIRVQADRVPFQHKTGADWKMACSRVGFKEVRHGAHQRAIACVIESVEDVSHGVEMLSNWMDSLVNQIHEVLI